MISASTLSTIEAIIPYLILAGIGAFFILRLVVPLVDHVWHAGKRKNEHTE